MSSPDGMPARDGIRASVLFADAPSGCLVMNPDGTIALVNPQLCRMFGYDDVELVGRPVEVLVPEARRAVHRHHRDDYDAAPRVGPMGKGREVVGRHHDGSEFPVDVRLAPTVLDGDACVIAFVDDISEQVRAEQELDATRALLTAILDHAPSLISVKGADGRYLLANRQVEVMTGIPNAEMIGRTDDDLFSPAEIALWRPAEEEVLAAGEPAQAEAVLNRPEGRRTFLSQRFPLLGDDGRAYAMCSISTDITSRKALEAAVDSARAEAERANRAKSQFLSRVSHELRTPLNSVMGFAQLLQMDGEDPRVVEGAEQILRAGRHLLELINEVLDISRIEAGELRLSVEPVRVADVLAEVSDLIRVQAEQRGLRFEPAEPGDHVLLADRHRLVQVLLNLGSNAVKFNRRGGRVKFSVSRSETDAACVRIAVRDDGPGITAEARERLFAPFERLGVDPALEGTGLGLALSRGLMQAMGGVIDVASTSGAGCTFWIELPAAAQSPTSVASSNGETTTATVLYIDDNPESIALVESLLTRRPHVRLLTAMQASIGLDLAASNDLQLVLVDVHLPDLGGEVVLARLLAEPRTAGVPVAMVSADASAGRARRLRAAGAAAMLAKPFDLDALLGLIDEFVPSDGAGLGGDGS